MRLGMAVSRDGILRGGSNIGLVRSPSRHVEETLHNIERFPSGAG